jgi:SAM-dependent methyltransferase
LREHYSYQHYADPAVAEQFDALRFGGPVGRYLLESQERLLAEALAPVKDRSVADVGTGTGRAAIGLARAGARVVGLDASSEMLRVARARADRDHVSLELGVADAHHLPFDDRSVDAAVCLRVLMHAIDWRQCVRELCRVARWRVVVDYPSRASVAALESATRRLRQSLGARVEAYRVISDGEIARAFEGAGFRVISRHKQFVLPIALHKAIGRIGLTRGVERGLAGVGLLRLFGSPVTVVAERSALGTRHSRGAGT